MFWSTSAEACFLPAKGTYLRNHRQRLRLRRKYEGKKLLVMLPQVRTYTVKEVAATTALPRQIVTRLFEHEPGVIILERTRRIHKRPYRSIRIPRACMSAWSSG